MRKGAVVSEDGRYRYRLTRMWGGPLGGLLPFVMLNPSTADAELDDPTVRRCIGFARDLGYDGVGVWNLYAYRTKSPIELYTAIADIIGPDNDRRLRNLFSWAREAQVPVVAAWGVNARSDRVRDVLAMPGAVDVLHHLGLSKYGAPRHPLYLRAGTPLTPWGVQR